MKLLHYLKEETTEDIIKTLKRDCSEIIKVYKSAHWALLRGESNDSNEFISKIPRIADSSKAARVPSSTPQEVHDYINDWFKEEFGWPCRNGVFTTGKLGTAGDYGTIYIFFPVNGYKYVYSPRISDLYSYMPMKATWDENKEYRSSWAKNRTRMTAQEVFYKIEWPEITKEYNFTDKNLVKAVHEGVGYSLAAPEVMFKCSKYYGLKYRQDERIRDEILFQLGLAPMKRGYDNF